MKSERLPEIYGNLKIFSIDAINLAQAAYKVKKNKSNSREKGISFSLNSLATPGIFEEIWSKSWTEKSESIVELGKNIISAVKSDLDMDINSKTVAVGNGLSGGTALYAFWKLFQGEDREIYLVAMRSNAHSKSRLYILEGSLNDFLDSIGTPSKQTSSGPIIINREVFIEEFGDLFKDLVIKQIIA